MATTDHGADFLLHDFDQCFRQMANYDGQIIDVCKFALLGYSSVFGAAIGLYKFGIEQKTDFAPAAVAIVSVGFIVGLVLFTLIVRNRVYFVRVARYVNELRDHFLETRPLGFENKSRMYGGGGPPYFYPWSSQLLAAYMLAFLNSASFGVLLYLARARAGSIVLWTTAMLIVQIHLAIRYLKSWDARTRQKDWPYQQPDQPPAAQKA